MIILYDKYTLFKNPKYTKTVYPLNRWIYHIRAENPLASDKGVMEYNGLIWKQLWALITILAFEILTEEEVRLGYYNMSVLITEGKAREIAKAVRKECIPSEKCKAYIDFAREKLFANGQIASIMESRGIILHPYMLPELTIFTVEKFAVFSSESAGFRVC